MRLIKKAIIDGVFKTYDLFNNIKLGKGVETQDLDSYYSVVFYTMYSMYLITVLLLSVIVTTDSTIIRSMCIIMLCIPSVIQYYHIFKDKD